MSNWYTSRETVKRAGNLIGDDQNSAVDRQIEAASREFDRSTRRYFIPRTEARTYRWPNRRGVGRVLWLDQGLISVTTLKTQAQNTSPTTVSASDFFLEPNNSGPPYNRIEIDLSSTAAFEAGDTPQRSIEVTGSWGYTANTRSVGTVASGLSSDATVTEFVCSNASVIDVGDTLLIENEQIFVSDRSFAALGSVLVNDASITSSMSDNTITLDGSHGVVAGEIIRLDAEEILVRSVATNVITVERAYNGTLLAAHSNDTAVNISRTLTIERGVNGTTAATHANATAISKYEPPSDISRLIIAQSLAMFSQEGAHYGRTVGIGDGAAQFDSKDLASLEKRTSAFYRRSRQAAI